MSALAAQAHAQAQAMPGPEGISAFVRMQGRLEALAGAFGLGGQAAMIDTYRAIFRHALDFPEGAPPGASRLSEDGTPIQFATTLGRAQPALRFVGDPAPPGASGAVRMSTAHAALAEVAVTLGLAPELAAIAPLLAELAPQTARALLEDPAGSLWIGAAFTPGAAPILRIYLNGSWGTKAAVKARLATFAAYFGQAAAWGRAESLMPTALHPIGLALTLGPGRPVRGAIYLRAFGLRLADYTALANFIAGPANAALIDRFGTALLGPDSLHPTPSAVFSMGFSQASRPSAELEFCTHCLYRDDAEAQRHLLALFANAGLDPAPYHAFLRHLASPSRPGPPHLHAFIGVDAKASNPAYTLYMKPDLSARR